MSDPVSAGLDADEQQRLDASLAFAMPVLTPALDAATASGDEGPLAHWPAGNALLEQSRFDLVPLSLAAQFQTVERATQRSLGLLDIALDRVDSRLELLLNRFATRKLPWEAIDAAVLVKLAASVLWIDQVRLALHAARTVLKHEPVEPRVLDAMRRLDARFDDVDELRTGKLAHWRPKVRSVLAAAEPQLHLASLFGTADAFGDVALAKTLEHQGSQTSDFLTLVASPTGTKPPRQWWPRMESLLHHDQRLCDLVVQLLALASEIALTPPDRLVHGSYVSSAVLFDETNTVLVRGLAWSARFVGEPAIPALSHLTLRSAAVVDGFDGVHAISSKTALAAIDSLGAIESPAAGEELERLFAEVPLAQFVRRIASVQGIAESRVGKRLEEMRREARRKPRATAQE